MLSKLTWGFIGLVLFGAAFPSIAHGATNASSTSKSKPKSKPPARLIVQRAPNFGTNLVLQLSIDGRKTADIPRDQHYGGTISAGRHTLTVISLPNTQSRRPISMRLTFQSGKVYLYTAMWDRDRLVLRPSTNYIPTHAVKPIR